MSRRFGSLRSVAIALGAAVIVLGSGAPRSGAATTKPADEPPRVQTADRAGDHWHVAYGVFVCDRYLPPIVSANDPVGVHTHGDGIIHVHPFFAAAAGKNAVLGKFFTTVDMAMTAKELRLPGGKTWKDGDACAAKPGHLRVLAFPDVAVSTSSSSGATTILVSAVSSVVAGDPAKIRLHDLRHTHVAHLIATGAHVKVISERVGHASTSFTMDRYGHLMEGQQGEAANAVGRLVDGVR